MDVTCRHAHLPPPARSQAAVDAAIEALKQLKLVQEQKQKVGHGMGCG